MKVTGISLEDWVAASKNETRFDAEPKVSCRELMALLKSEPNHFVAQLEQSVARAVTKPWGVQVATGFNRDQALATYARAMNGSYAPISWKEVANTFSQSRD
jgi:hypothetical protein